MACPKGRRREKILLVVGLETKRAETHTPTHIVLYTVCKVARRHGLDFDIPGGVASPKGGTQPFQLWYNTPIRFSCLGHPRARLTGVRRPLLIVGWCRVPNNSMAGHVAKPKTDSLELEWALLCSRGRVETYMPPVPSRHCRCATAYGHARQRLQLYRPPPPPPASLPSVLDGIRGGF